MILVAENVLKIVDINSGQLYGYFIQWLKAEAQPTYLDSDNNINEPMYNASELLDGIEGGGYDVAPMIKSQLEEISALCCAHEAGYFRVTY